MISAIACLAIMSQNPGAEDAMSALQNGHYYIQRKYAGTFDVTYTEWAKYPGVDVEKWILVAVEPPGNLPTQNDIKAAFSCDGFKPFTTYKDSDLSPLRRTLLEAAVDGNGIRELHPSLNVQGKCYRTKIVLGTPPTDWKPEPIAPWLRKVALSSKGPLAFKSDPALDEFSRANDLDRKTGESDAAFVARAGTILDQKCMQYARKGTPRFQGLFELKDYTTPIIGDCGTRSAMLGRILRRSGVPAVLMLGRLLGEQFVNDDCASHVKLMAYLDNKGWAVADLSDNYGPSDTPPLDVPFHFGDDDGMFLTMQLGLDGTVPVMFPLFNREIDMVESNDFGLAVLGSGSVEGGGHHQEKFGFKIHP